jgi:hypothetical protein
MEEISVILKDIDDAVSEEFNEFEGMSPEQAQEFADTPDMPGKSKIGGAIAAKAKEAAAFGVGNLIDATGVGALTGMGPIGAATTLSALQNIHNSGGVVNAAINVGKQALSGGAGGASATEAGSAASTAEAASTAATEQGFFDKAIDGVSSAAKNFWEGATDKAGAIVKDTQGNTQWGASLARAAGKYAKNRLKNSLSKNKAGAALSAFMG